MTEREPFEPIDPADNEDELRLRSESISEARDAAFDRGADAYSADGDAEAESLRHFPDHPTLQRDFMLGWEEAASWDDDDSFCCSQDSSMRDTHGLPGRDL